jgi:hypothetical protein
VIPQDNFTVVAQVAPAAVPRLRSLLARMNFPQLPGTADPDNKLVPFRAFETIHFARFVVLADNTLDDRAAHYPQLPSSEPIYLCFMVDCDGDADALLSRMADDCAALREIFETCEDFDASRNIKAWLRAHRVRPSASYVNWVGRSVEQVRQEARLHDLLRKALPDTTEQSPQELLAELRRAVAGAVPLTPPPETPLAWRIRNLVHLMVPLVATAAGLIILILFPRATVGVLLIATAIFLILLRWHELRDPIVDNTYDPAWVRLLREGEDYDVTNQYTAMGSIKPGWFRLVLQFMVLYVIDWTARHIFTRGGLARIGTIHFAHWVFLDDYRRGFFCSNYDGAHEAYMDDFINKAAFGLNLSFSSYIAYPQTDWLLLKGAWRERDFKRFQRRHQLPTDVWYKAYPSLTARDLARNARIRNGFEKTTMSDDEIRRWLAEI